MLQFSAKLFFQNTATELYFCECTFPRKVISNVGVNYFVGIQLIEINHAWISQFLTILDYI